MKYYIISGEVSGDLHGSNLIYHLNQNDSETNFRCWGGDLMKAQGAHIVRHIKELAIMGFFEVIMNLRTIIKNINFCKKDLLKFEPDALILIDYPGFNLRIAKFAKSQKIPVYYYISPQVWAWKKNRVYQIKKYVRKLYTILPFEKKFYAQFDYEVEYLGHPLLDAVSNYKNRVKSDFTLWKKPGRPLVALLPGSRVQEINNMLGKMLAVAREFPNCDFVIAGVASLGIDFYQSFTSNLSINVVFNQTYPLFEQADAALVSSGTATLETALFDVPQIVCYQTSAFSFNIAKLLVNIQYISLVNLISQRELVRELIQQEMTVSNMVVELNRILNDSVAKEIKFNYKELRVLLGGEGASKRVATSITNDLKFSDKL